MARVVELEPHFTTEELFGKYKGASDLARDKWHAIWLISKGEFKRKEIAQIMGISRGYLSDWVHEYNERGEEFGVDRRADNGAQLALDEEQMALLGAALEDAAPDGGLWDGVKARQWIEDELGVKLCANTARDYLRRLGYELARGRPIHPRGDKEAQEHFKKKD